MILLPIKDNIWGIYAVCKNEEVCELLTFLQTLEKKYEGSKNRLLAILEEASNHAQGPTLFHDDISHLINEKHKIFEFIAGKLRLLWFYSSVEKKVVICSHAFLKKSNKTPKRDIEQAIKVKKAYHEAAENKQIKIISDE